MGDFNQVNRTDMADLFSDRVNARQLIKQSTTNYGTILNLAFTNIPRANKDCGVIDNCWSDHKIIWCSLQL